MSKFQNYIELNAVFRFMENHDVVVGINNIIDKEPPMVGSLSTNANTIAGFYDTLGRYLFAQAREKRLPWSLGFFSYYTATRSLYEDLRIRAEAALYPTPMVPYPKG